MPVEIVDEPNEFLNDGAPRLDLAQDLLARIIGGGLEVRQVRVCGLW